MAAAPAWATTTTTVTVKADAFVVNANWVNTNYGELLRVQLWRGLYTTAGGTTYDREDRSLLKFDVSVIPDGAVITSASLTLVRWEQPVPGNLKLGTVGNINQMPMNVYLVTTDWDESSVTWNKATSSKFWSTPGGDYNSTLVATNNASPGADQAVVWGVTALITEWINNPASYHGLMLLTPYMGAAQKDIMLAFYSDEGTADFKPTLSVTYSMASPSLLVPEPVTVAGLAVGLGALGRYIRRRRLA